MLKTLQLALGSALGCLLGATCGEPAQHFMLLERELRVPQIDIAFVLDMTSSMQDEIDGVRDGIVDCASQLGQRQLDSQIGLSAFRNTLAGEQVHVLQFDSSTFASDERAFQCEVGRLRADGGRDEPESSLNTLKRGCELPFRPVAIKVLLLIADAPPHVPDIDVRDLDAVLSSLSSQGTDQLHLVTTEQCLPDYRLLQTQALGEFVPLGRDTGRQFASALPVCGEDIAERAVRSVISEFDCPGNWSQVLPAVSVWTDLPACSSVLLHMVFQNHYLHRPLLNPRQGTTGILDGLAAGFARGGSGQLFFAAIEAGSLLWLSRVFAWTMLGVLLGAGMSRVVPNLRVAPAAVLGGIGGALGALSFLLAAQVLGETPGRLVGAAVLGAFIGLAVGLVEAAFREAWLEVKYGDREVVLVSLGNQPVKLGSNGRLCAVYVRNAQPVECEYRFVDGQVLRKDIKRETTETISFGHQESFGKVLVTVKAGEESKGVAAYEQSKAPPPPRRAGDRGPSLSTDNDEKTVRQSQQSPTAPASTKKPPSPRR